MLLVGIWRHGFGNWEAIQADEELPFAKKFFLDDGKKKAKEKEAKPKKDSKDDKKGPRSPGAVHLVRRGEFLLRTLQDLEIASNIMKGSSSRHDSPAAGPSTSRAKVPTAGKPKVKASSSKGKAKAESPDEKASTSKKSKSSTSKSSTKQDRPRAEPSSSESEQSSYSSMDEEECKSLLRPVRKELKELKKGTDHLSREQKVTVLKDCLSAVGTQINGILNESKGNQSAKDQQKKHLWTFASYFWPKTGVSHKQLSAMGQSFVLPCERLLFTLLYQLPKCLPNRLLQHLLPLFRPLPNHRRKDQSCRKEMGFFCLM